MIAIILIIKKVHPAYSLILGALIGGFIGGGGLTGTVNTMISGAQGMMSSVLRILTSGILAGALIHSGATVIDSLPHGSFFHATSGSVNMAIKDRIKIAEIPKAAEAYAPAAFHLYRTVYSVYTFAAR